MWYVHNCSLQKTLDSIFVQSYIHSSKLSINMLVNMHDVRLILLVWVINFV